MMRFIKNKFLIIIFLIVLLASFIIHIENRNDHYQECDSSLVYDVLYNFPTVALGYTVGGYTKSNIHFISKELADKILKQDIVINIIEKYVRNFDDSRKKHFVDLLSNTSPLQTMRLSFITIFSNFNLPHFIVSAFALPWSSTYSFGSGVAYGIISNEKTSYEDFMSRSLVVTNVLFHISVLLVFLIGLRIGFGQLPSVLASLIMLFSISLYSYGYHLGNTIWNISSGAVWLYIFVHYLGEEQLLKKMSLCTGILIFFNYLIIFYWISLLLLYFLYERGARLSWRDRSIMILKTQYFSIISIILCVLLFYQPGQGNRGTIASIDTILSYPYYIILNFFAFYNGKELFLEIFQFIIGLFLVLSSFYYASSLRLKDNVEMLYVAKISIIIVLVYFVSVLIGVLGFAPSRHILYLAPVLFIMVNLTIYKFYNNYNQKKIFLILMVCLIIVGFTCVHNRLNDTKDKTARINVDNDIDEIVVFDYSYNLVYKKWKTSKSAFFSDPLRFSKGKTYLYISQTTDIKDAINAWKRVVKVKVLYGYNDIGNAYFIAHNPNPKYFNHNRPNNVYLAKFQVAD